MGNAVPIPSPEPCHPDAERKRALAVSRGRPEATFPRQAARVPEVRALHRLAGARLGSRGHSRGDRGTGRVSAGRPRRHRAQPRSPARPPRPRAAPAPAPGAAGVWGAAAAGANLARGRAAPARYLPSGRRRSSARRRARLRARESERETAPAKACLVPRALSALPQQAGARGLRGATRLWRDRARRASGPGRCRLQGQLHPPPTARAARLPAGHASLAGHAPSHALSSWAPPLLVGHAPSPRPPARAPPRRLGHPECPAPHPCCSCVTRSCGQILSPFLSSPSLSGLFFSLTVTSMSFLAGSKAMVSVEN